ncbi:MAG: homoserine O-acetyltransferase [Vicinamibacteria bacterium]
MSSVIREHPKTHSLVVNRLTLESGEELTDIRVAYRTWGRLAPGGGNAVLVEHALTGSPHLDEWWGDILGPGRALDPEHDFIVATNALGSCYGTTGPTAARPGSTVLWGADFPRITVRDMVNLEAKVADTLNVERWSMVLGGSLGGMRALEWAASYPQRVASIAALGAPARHSAWAIGWNAIARSALLADPKFLEGRYAPSDPPRSGLAAARATSMLSYRSFEGFDERFGRKIEDGRFEVERWLDRHGESFVERFDANSWLTLSKAMDTHDIARGRGDLASIVATLDVRALFVGISSDVLYPPQEIEAVAKVWPASECVLLESTHGHDAFLIEGEVVNAILKSFRGPVAPRARRTSTLVH